MLGVARVQASSGAASLLAERYSEITTKQQLHAAVPVAAPTKTLPLHAAPVPTPSLATAVGTIRLFHLLPGDERSRTAVLAASCPGAPLCAQLEWKNTPAQRKLTSILSAVKRKWSNVSGIASLQLHPGPIIGLTSPAGALSSAWPLHAEASTLTLQQAHEQAAFPPTLVCFYTLPAAVIAPPQQPNLAPASVAAAPTHMARQPQSQHQHQQHQPQQHPLTPQSAAAASSSLRAPTISTPSSYAHQLPLPSHAPVALATAATSAHAPHTPSSAGLRAPAFPSLLPNSSGSLLANYASVARVSAPATPAAAPASFLPTRSLLPPSTFRAYDSSSSNKKAKLTHSFHDATAASFATMPAQHTVAAAAAAPASVPTPVLAWNEGLQAPPTPAPSTPVPPQRTSSVKKSLVASFNEVHASAAAAASSPHRRATGTPRAHAATLQDVTAAAVAATAAASSSRMPLGTLFSTSNHSALNISNNMLAGSAPLIALAPAAAFAAAAAASSPAAAAVAPAPAARIPGHHTIDKENAPPALPSSPSKLPMLMWGGDAESLAILHALNPSTLPPINANLLASNESADRKQLRASATQAAAAASLGLNYESMVNSSSLAPATPSSNKSSGGPSAEPSSGSKKQGSGSSKGAKRKAPSPSASDKKKATKTRSPASAASSKGKGKGKGELKRKAASEKAARQKSKKKRKGGDGVPAVVAEEEDDVDWDEWALDLEKGLSSDDTESDLASSPASAQVDSPVEPEFELEDEEEEIEVEAESAVPALPAAAAETPSALSSLLSSYASSSSSLLAHEFMAADPSLAQQAEADPFVAHSLPSLFDHEQHAQQAAHAPYAPLSSQPYGGAALYGHEDADWLGGPIHELPDDRLFEQALVAPPAAAAAAAPLAPSFSAVGLPPRSVVFPSVREFELDASLESQLASFGGDALQFVQAAVQSDTC